jgi:hypothetical protein
VTTHDSQRDVDGRTTLVTAETEDAARRVVGATLEA